MNPWKTCFKCGEQKAIDDFYRHPMMADGRLGKCKDCTKLDMRIDRVTKPRVRAYDRARSSEPHRVALRKKIADRWRQEHPERAKAQQHASNAVRDGRLPREDKCQVCGLPADRIEKHHPDYSRPLLVMWLCKPCHVIADKIRRLMETAA